MIKCKEDARQWLMNKINNQFEGDFFVLNEILYKNNQEGFYHWNANGSRFLNGEKQINFEEVIKIAYKNRKLINEWYKDLI